MLTQYQILGSSLKLLQDPSTLAGGHLRLDGVIWSNRTTTDAFDFLGGGNYGNTVTFNGTSGVTSSSAGGGLVITADGRCGNRFLSKILATDTISMSTTNSSTNASQIAMSGPSVIANTSTLTFSNPATGSTSTASPYQYAGDTTFQTNTWTTLNAYNSGIIYAQNSTAAALNTGAIVAQTGGISSATAFVQNTSTVGQIVTSTTTNTQSSSTSPNIFNGSVGFKAATNFDDVATFNQDVRFNSAIYYGDGSVTNVKSGQTMMADNILTLYGVNIQISMLKVSN